MTRYLNEKFLESPDFQFYIEPFTIAGGESIPPHSHEFVELVFIAKGRGKHEYNGRLYDLTEGDVFIIEPEVEHAYHQEDHTNLFLYNVLFQPALLTSEFEALAKVDRFVDFYYVEPFVRKTSSFESHLNLHPSERVPMKLQLDSLVEEFNEKQLGYRILVKTKLIELFIFLSRCYDTRIHKPMTTHADEERIIRRVAEFIELHHNRPLTLQQVSGLCEMSHSTFTAKFKNYTGKTFIEYRNEIRIKVAQQMLRNSDAKVLEIAQDVGFEDLSFFNKVFKHIAGLSPGQYRRQHVSK